MKLRTSSLKFSLLFIVFSFLGTAQAAPIPGTSSSVLVGADLGKFISEYGFTIHAGGTSWIQSQPPKDIASLTTLYRSPTLNQGVQASLTVRVDRLKEETSLNRYVRQWMKDYPRLGFEVLSSKPLRVNGQTAHLLDVINKASAKQLRQIVFIKNRTAVVLTCRDHRETFDETVKTCNEIIKNFHWRI